MKHFSSLHLISLIFFVSLSISPIFGITIEGAAGFNFSTENIDIRLYDSLSKTEFDSISENFEKPRYGAGISIFNKSFPTSLKIGKNSYSKSLSKIKNPSPSSIASPLTKSFSFSSGLGCSLPTLSSSQQPLSAALNFVIPETILSCPIYFDIFSDIDSEVENKNAAVSISTSKKIGKFNSINLAFTGSRFFIENNSSVLKKANAQFEGDYFFSGLSEFAIRTPIFKSKARIGIQESPYDVNSIWFDVNCRTTVRNFLLDFSYFAIPTTKNSPKVAPIIGASSTIQKTVEQAGINPQFIIQFDDKNNSTIRFGIHAIESWKITSTKNAELLNVGKIRSAVSFEQRYFDLKYDFSLTNILLSGNPPNKSATPEKYFSNSISSDFRTKFGNISSDFALKYYPPYNSDYEPKRIIDFSISAAPKKLKNFTTRNKVSVTFKGSEKSSGEFSTSASYKFKTKNLNSSVKVEFNIPF